MCTRRTPTPPSAWGAGPGAARHQRRVQLRVSTRALDGWLTAAPTRPSTQAGGHKPTRTSIPRLDSGPQVIERNAVIEGSAVDDLAVPQLQESRVAVLIGLAVVGDPAAVPADDHGVAVGMDRADRDRAEGRCWQESCPKGRQHLVDELLPAPYSLEASECPPIRQTSSGANTSLIAPVPCCHASKVWRMVCRLARCGRWAHRPLACFPAAAISQGQVRRSALRR